MKQTQVQVRKQPKSSTPPTDAPTINKKIARIWFGQK
jgi:hypothetical protein